MNESQIGYWDALALAAHAESVVSFRRAIYKILEAIEFGAVYFLAPVVADRRVGRVLWNVGFPKEWEKHYNEKDRSADPLPTIALGRSSGFRWSDAPQLRDLTLAERQYLERLEEFGMGEGVAVLCAAPNARSGFVGVGLPADPEAIDEAMIRKVSVAAQLCFQRYCALVSGFSEELPDLSQRELDVIRWIGEGKSNAVIAEILGISKYSVDSYVKRIFAKLGVSDRTAAAVKAVALGLIAPGRHSKKAAHRPRWNP
ncbi:LuxR C-terminal-related transcriptional regulator [Altererythrobacter arenosus]|uniref:LuxR C-terminal-related transcriptional regulator n=1 Tax=Altererythrobacter arenosus TaxID=3032592 RepID=A0ABY8FUU5_9SPHN|nr:LuxR family transcriptional regulator [Altererythrobacter sp. CAU 1644]WFL78780.1 LuxR C-terminal-related transcriptional regulator [Altererythrobacter sp. CAU 1644]